MGTYLVDMTGLGIGSILCLGAAAYATWMRRKVRDLCARLEGASSRELRMLEAARILTAASRESTPAVLTALDRTLRDLEPSLDAVLVFVPDVQELACVHATGPRAEHFAGTRLQLERPASLAARAALCGHRVELTRNDVPLIPTDRAAIAVPMIGADGLAAVVYASSSRAPIGDPDVLVNVAAQAASPYAIAAERECDRARATYDALTGLYAPRAFREMLSAELSAARPDRSAGLSLWFIDTDRFKYINDTCGHARGDAVLQRMAALLREHTIEGVDAAARNGGDEFCAVVRNTQKIAAIDRAQRFCEAVRACDFGVGVRITASIGVASYPYDADGPAELLEAADAAMYHSKRTGRDRVSFLVERGSFAVYE